MHLGLATGSIGPRRRCCEQMRGAPAHELGPQHVIVTDEPDATAQIRAIAHQGTHRIAEVVFARHIDLDAGVIAIGGVYCSAPDRPEIPYWKLGFADTTLRLSMARAICAAWRPRSTRVRCVGSLASSTGIRACVPHPTGHNRAIARMARVVRAWSYDRRRRRGERSHLAAPLVHAGGEEERPGGSRSMRAPSRRTVRLGQTFSQARPRPR
jgi:hypothetical protein